MRRTWMRLCFASTAIIVVVGIVLIANSGSDQLPADDTPAEHVPDGNQAPADPAPEQSFVRSGSSNIYTIDVATRALSQVTRNGDEQVATGPAWSTRKRIVFSESSSGDELAYLIVVSPDGSGRRKIQTRMGNLLQPTWSPDGRRIAAMQLGKGLHVIDPRTHSARRLHGTRRSDEGPAWSPDGKTILFQRQVTAGNLDIYQVDPTGDHLGRLTNDPLQQIGPAWSPDGSSVLFAEQQKNGNWAVATLNLNGGNRKLVTDPRISSQDPAWSPDGKKIAFVLQGRSRDSIAVVNADGGRPVLITPRDLVQPMNPVWSPDGKRIAFAAYRAARPPPSRLPGS